LLGWIENLLSVERGEFIARWSLALIMLWFGAMNFIGPGALIAERWLEGHVFFASLSAHAVSIAFFVGGFEVIAGALLVLPALSSYRWVGGFMVSLYALAALSLFLTNYVWIDSLGGFPAIGSGQGLLKYITLGGLGLFLSAEGAAKYFSWRSEVTADRATALMLTGLFIVLVWIGAMKFTAIEAQGIDPLLRTSPFFGWMTRAYSTQEASNFIGIIEISTALLLLNYGRSRLLFMLGAALCVGTFVMTLSFMITLPAWDAGAGFPVIGGSGHFLLKDLGLLGATILLLTIQPVERLK
jgi:reactive chlorine resistance protein C